MPSLTVEPGTGVKLSGEFKYSGTATGTLRVDFFQVGSDARPMILHALTLEKAGPWEVEVPKGLGKIHVLAFIDATGNGPQLAEPSFLMKDLDVQQVAMPGLELAVADGAANEFATDSQVMMNPVTPAPPPDGGNPGTPGAAAAPGGPAGAAAAPGGPAGATAAPGGPAGAAAAPGGPADGSATPAPK